VRPAAVHLLIISRMNGMINDTNPVQYCNSHLAAFCSVKNKRIHIATLHKIRNGRATTLIRENTLRPVADTPQ